MIEPEHHAHAHHAGFHWVDVMLAGCAVVVPAVSVMISIRHGRTMEKLVAANEKQVKASTLPILRFGTGNMSGDVRVIHFDLRNGGTGPAIIEWLRIKWNGQPTAGPRDLFEHCCRATPLPTMPILRNIAYGFFTPSRPRERSRHAMSTPIVSCRRCLSIQRRNQPVATATISSLTSHPIE